jgi:hypothetical protein
LTKLEASKVSKSSKCSPVPKKIIGLCVAATALREPPPFAWPSNLVIITDPTYSIFKCFSLAEASLTDTSIHHENSCVWLYCCLNFFDFIKQSFFLLVPS